MFRLLSEKSGLLNTHENFLYNYYIDIEETPKQINPTGLKSDFEVSKISA